jgi:hypothetical protein
MRGTLSALRFGASSFLFFLDIHSFLECFTYDLSIIHSKYFYRPVWKLRSTPLAHLLVSQACFFSTSQRPVLHPELPHRPTENYIRATQPLLVPMPQFIHQPSPPLSPASTPASLSDFAETSNFADSNGIITVVQDLDTVTAKTKTNSYLDREERAIAALLTRFKNLVSLAALPAEDAFAKEIAAAEGLRMEVESNALVCVHGLFRPEP